MRHALILSLACFTFAACKGDDSTPPDETGVPATDSDAPTDNDGDGSPEGEDCDDDDAAVNPDATELCDGLDNNCDGETDEGVKTTAYTDADGDGFGDDSTAAETCEVPDGGTTLGGDCDDTDPSYNPGAAETECDDPNDYNCDGSVGYADNDSDGFAACQECDDNDAAVNPSAAEICDERDNNCDGAIDEGVATTSYADTDADGYGDADYPVAACEVPAGYVTDATDCDDGDVGVNPAAQEICDSLDNDCDSLIDDADDSVDLSTGATSYADADGDSFGDADAATLSCATPAGAVDNAEDCDDGDATLSPAATEICDGLDNDCDGATDDDDGSLDLSSATTWYADGDSDRFGDPDVTTTACESPSGFTSSGTDCDDADAAINPVAMEVCDTLDNDCDGLIDDEDDGVFLSPSSAWYADADGDTYGDPADQTFACEAPSATHTADDNDCDDTDAAINPTATESCDDADNDCDGVIDQIVYLETGFDSGLPSGMTVNGNGAWASASGNGYLSLTEAWFDEVATALLNDTVPADDLYVSFNFSTGGGAGTGADGLSLALLDPSTAATAIGSAGGGFGVLNLTGYAVEVDTFQNGGWDPDGNHIALIDAADLYTVYATSSAIPTLENAGELFIEMTKSGSTITVALDGTTLFSHTLSSFPYSELRVGVTAATGGSSNYHYVDDLTVMCP